MMRRFTSAPKPAVRVASIIAVTSLGVDAQSVAHAVEAREVARRLGRRDEVVGAETQAKLRHRELDDRRAGVAQRLDARARPTATTSSSAPSTSSRTSPTRLPATPSSTCATSDGAGSGSDVESSGSCPAMTSSSIAASVTVLANGPI